MTSAPMYQPQLFGGEHVESVEDNDWWCTPESILAPARAFLGTIDLDPCSNGRSTVQAVTTYTIADDGLSHPWHGRVWCNPPYSDPGPWLRRCAEMPSRGGEAIALPKGDWSTRWWQESVRTAPARCLLQKRINFLHSAPHGGSTANFPSILVYWGPRVDEFKAAFEPMGEILTVPPGTEEPSKCQHAHCVWLRTLPPAERRRVEGDPERGCPGCGGTGLDPNGGLPSAPGYSS